MAYKLQIFCLMILIYIVVSFCWNNYKKTKSRHTIIFQWMLITGIVYLFLDMITVYTVNHLTTVNPILNRFLHRLFLLSIFTFLFLVFVYLCALCELDFSSKRMKACIFMPFFSQCYYCNNQYWQSWVHYWKIHKLFNGCFRLYMLCYRFCIYAVRNGDFL